MTQAALAAHDRSVAVAALRAAVPYLRLYQGKVFVVKAGGETFARREDTQALVEQLAVLHQLGIRLVLVHGGGPQTDRVSRELGLEPQRVDGRRITCERTLEVSTMVLAGHVSTQVVAACRSAGLPAIGVSGVDAGLIQASRRPPVAGGNGEHVDYGHVGDVRDVDPRVLATLLDDGFVPVVSPVSADGEGAVLNVNADVVAAELARAMGAEKLVLVTGAEGIRADPGDPGSLVSSTDLAGLGRLEAAGALRDGMLPKVAAIRAALTGGVPRAHVLSYRTPDGLLLEVFTNEGCGTLVVREQSELSPAEFASPPEAS